MGGVCARSGRDDQCRKSYRHWNNPQSAYYKKIKGGEIKRGKTSLHCYEFNITRGHIPRPYCTTETRDIAASNISINVRVQAFLHWFLHTGDPHDRVVTSSGGSITTVDIAVVRTVITGSIRTARAKL